MGIIQLSLKANPRIQTADYCFFKGGILHPDRILEVHDLVYVLQGEWEIWESNTAYLLKPGDAVFLYSGRRHYGQRPCAPGTKTRYIHFYPERDDVFSARENDSGPSASGIVIPTFMRCGSNETIRQLFEEVIHLYWSSDRHNQMLVRIRLGELLVSLAASQHQSKAGAANSVDYVINLLEQAPEKNFDINELADKIQVSRRNLTARFKEKTGLSIKQFQLNLKIRRAAAMLENSPFVSVKEVAEQYGFYDEFHFSKLFKQRLRLGPSEYKKRGRNSSDRF